MGHSGGSGGSAGAWDVFNEQQAYDPAGAFKPEHGFEAGGPATKFWPPLDPRGGRAGAAGASAGAGAGVRRAAPSTPIAPGPQRVLAPTALADRLRRPLGFRSASARVGPAADAAFALPAAPDFALPQANQRSV